MAAMLRYRLDPASMRKDWRTWLAEHFADYTSAPMGVRHERFWDWMGALREGERPRARVEVWPRGGGKSASTELGCAYVGSQPTPARHFVLYVSETQAQADKHVQAIANMLLAAGMKPAANALGQQKGWRHEEVRTANGFNVASFGIDAGVRGARLDRYRPDLIVFDDVDGRHDTPAAVQKKIEIITETILPSGSIDCAVIFVQNKIHDQSIVSRLVDNTVDFLRDREPATVEPAVWGLEYAQILDAEGLPRYVITAGEPSWAGQNLATCERQLNDWGPKAFLREAQHDVEQVDGGMWDRARDIDPFRVTERPQFDRVVVAIDPSATSTGDEAGIIVAGVSYRFTADGGREPHAYVIDDASLQGPPRAWAEAAVAAYNLHMADVLVAEKNNGGEMGGVTIDTVPGAPYVKLVTASRGKATRAEPIQALSAKGQIHMVGHFPELEKELCRWTQGMPSPNRLDAFVWAMTELLLERDTAGPVGDALAQVWASQFGGSR